MKNKVKIIITGSRLYNNYDKVEQLLKDLEIHERECDILTSMTYGVDRMGFDFARKYGKQVYIYPVRWEEHGDDAIHKAHEAMVKTATHCIVIWDGNTSDLVSQDILAHAKTHNLKTVNLITQN